MFGNLLFAVPHPISHISYDTLQDFHCHTAWNSDDGGRLIASQFF